jgi:hypothetical protein
MERIISFARSVSHLASNARIQQAAYRVLLDIFILIIAAQQVAQTDIMEKTKSARIALVLAIHAATRELAYPVIRDTGMVQIAQADVTAAHMAII